MTGNDGQIRSVVVQITGLVTFWLVLVIINFVVPIFNIVFLEASFRVIIHCEVVPIKSEEIDSAC